jgi:hypothetical protein
MNRFMFVMFASLHRRLAEEIDAEIERLELLGWDFDAVTRDDFAELVKAGDRLRQLHRVASRYQEAVACSTE